MREAAEGRPITGHPTGAPRRGAATIGAGGEHTEDRPRNRAGQRTPPTEGEFPAECRAVRSPTEGRRGAPRGNATGTEDHPERRQTTDVFPREAHKKHREATQKAPNKDRTPKFSHEKHTKSTQKISVFTPFLHRLQGILKRFTGLLQRLYTYPHHPQTVDL